MSGRGEDVQRAIGLTREAYELLRGLEIPGRSTELTNGRAGLREAVYWLRQIPAALTRGGGER